MKMSLAEQFDSLGYVVIRHLLSPTEVALYKSKLQAMSGFSDKDFDEKRARLKSAWTFNDGVTRHRDWWPLLFHEKLIKTMRDILGPTVRYTQHSDLTVHAGTVGWHRDSVNRQLGVGPDWDESRDRYQVARVGIYLQSYAESGSALGVIPGSHRKESTLARIELGLQDRFRRYFNKPGVLIPLLSVRPVWIRTEPGDCVIFSQRIYHTGSYIHGPKYAIFLSYGVENEHSRRHRRYYLYERPDAKYEDFHPDLAEQLKKADLLLPAGPPS